MGREGKWEHAPLGCGHSTSLLHFSFSPLTILGMQARRHLHAACFSSHQVRTGSVVGHVRSSHLNHHATCWPACLPSKQGGSLGLETQPQYSELESSPSSSRWPLWSLPCFFCSPVSALTFLFRGQSNLKPLPPSRFYSIEGCLKIFFNRIE